MAVDTRTSQRKPSPKREPQWAIGLNVFVMTVLAVILVIGLQWIGYHYTARADLTSSGVNSLTDATVNLLTGLDQEVRITSLYFETDLEDEDQAKYRAAVDDLIELYRINNRGKIETASINPLQDHEQRKAVFQRLGQLDKIKKESADHAQAVATFQDEVLPQLTQLMTGEVTALNALGTVDGDAGRLVEEVRLIYTRLQEQLNQTSLSLADALASDVPAYGAATNALRGSYAQMKRALDSVISVGRQFAATPGRMDAAVEQFFIDAEGRYAAVTDLITAQETKINALPQLEFDALLRDLRNETGNAILVETDQDARVLSFPSLWPALNPQLPANSFKDRRFLGEQKLTSAILQLTQPNKSAVVFVRHGGPPLFFAGLMTGQRAPYTEMKAQLEDANFAVYEWDLAAATSPPAMDPAPERTLYVILRPSPPPGGPFNRQQQQAPFGPPQLEALKSALGDAPRAVFLAGFQPSFGPIPADYEYNAYLKDNWGMEVDADRLLLTAEAVGPDRFRFIQRNPAILRDARFTDHPITTGLASRPSTFPLVVPVQLADEPPADVTTQKLAWFAEQEGLWAAKDVQYYLKQTSEQFVVKNPEDYSGDFTAVAAATKGDGKVILLSAKDFATDAVALASEFAVVGGGLALRPANPGNAALFINALHWLNDNTEWMNLGTPMDLATLTVSKNSGSMRFVQALVLGIWPGLALCCGLVVWMVRRS